MTHPDQTAEQAHLDRAHRRLEELRAASQATLRDALLSSAGGTPQTHVEREAMVDNATRRLAQLDLHGESLCFGRIDTEARDAFHIGRVAINDIDQTPLVVDWRAPVAEPFYRATGAHPLGLRRRRHFLTDGPALLGIEDELFGWGDGPDGAVVDGTPGGSLGLPGSGALLAALERSRSGRMRDIVATVQREQDEIIRAPLAGILVVQGGPGTGKTAVALHRAAYLLYTHRFPLERQGVVVVGPNRLFLRYIEQVLPSLGESGVELATIATLVAAHVGDISATGSEPQAMTRLKGDERMARVIAKAVHDRARALPADVTFVHAGHSLRISVSDSADLVAAGRRRGGAHNAARPLVERTLFAKLHAQWVAAAARRRRHFGPGDADGDGAPAEDVEPVVVEDPPSVEDLAAELRRHPDVRAALERIWPRLTPMELLHDLFGASALVDLAAKRWLTDDERRMLHRRRSDDVAHVRWTLADLPLLDEAAARLGPRRGRRDDGRVARTYGHIVVDEAQDLTPMQLRVLARRSLSGSMTLVGDVAQATGPTAPDDWKEVLAHLPEKRPPTIAHLTVNYRTPVELMDYAGRVLAAAQPGARLPESVRSTGVPPSVVNADGDGIDAAVVAAVLRERDAIGDGTVAVIHPPSMRDVLMSALVSVGIDANDADHNALDTPVTLVPVDLVKGLEFDAALVVEPAALVEEADQGLRALYVALTRATKRLAVVHERPLPPALADRR